MDESSQFELIDPTHEEQPANHQTISNFEVLSNIDPEDEFLNNHKSISVIDSIISRPASHSEQSFSIIKNSHLHSIIHSLASVAPSQNNSLPSQLSLGKASSVSAAGLLLNDSRFSTIQPQRDIYVEDIVMQKLIFYISLFSDEVQASLSRLRSKEQLSHLS